MMVFPRDNYAAAAAPRIGEREPEASNVVFSGIYLSSILLFVLQFR